MTGSINVDIDATKANLRVKMASSLHNHNLHIFQTEVDKNLKRCFTN